MAIERYRKVITPFLVGQRRDGLGRVRDIDSEPWEVLGVHNVREREVDNQDERIRRMGVVYSSLSEKVKEIASGNAIPVSLAGDCVSTLGVLAGLQKAHKQPDRILWLDAHGDFHTWETTYTKYIGGMPLAMLVGRGDHRIADATELSSYPEDRIILADARDLDPGEKETLESSRITKCGIDDIFKYIQAHESLYIHWDTDVVDAEQEMPALKYHVKSGPSYSAMVSLFRSLQNNNIIAVSVSAWHEEKDLDNKTATACLKLLGELGVNINLI